MKQIFTKLFSRVAMVACLATMFAGTAFADTVSFSYSDYKGQGTTSTGSKYTMTKTDVSITNTKFFGNNSYAHFYASGITTVTPSSGVTITEIALTASATNYNGYQSSGTITASTGSVSGSTSSTTVTWSGSATQAFTISNNKQIRWTSIVVTYSKSGGGDQPTTYTVTYDKNANDASGSMADSNSPYSAGSTVTVLSNSFVRNGYSFSKWNTAANGQGTDYAPGATFSISANTTLYAQWEATSSADVTYDFTGSDYTVSNGVLSNGSVSFSGAGSANFKMNSGYFMMGKNNAYITFPTYSSDVEKIVVTGKSGASGSVGQNIFVGDTPVSTATTGATGINTYVIADGYQEAGTVYTLKVTTDHNTQITKIEVYFKDANAPSFTISNNNELAYNATSGSFDFTVNNPAGGTTTVTENVDWISNVSVSASSVTFTTTANDETTSRTGNITLTYTYDTNKTVTKTVSIIQEGAPIPAIVAEDVSIAYNATSGSITFSISNEPSPAGTLAAATASEWITLGTVEATVPFTCSANNTVAARIATVTLTYTYGSSKTVTKDVTVTQAADPNAVNNISDISKTGDYIVKGTIVAISNRGFIVGDGTGYAYYYKGSEFTPNSYAIGNMVKLSGAVTVYGGVYQFGSSTTIEAATESNYSAEAPTVLTGSQMDARVASTTPAQLSNYVQYEGILSVSGTYYNITSIDGANTAKGSISYPVNTSFTSLNGKQVVVKGYYVGISSSQYYNTMLGSIEEVVLAEPTITIGSTSVNATAAESDGTVSVTCSNMGSDPALEVQFFASDGSTPATYDWFDADIDSEGNVYYEISANTGDARTAYFKVYGLDEGANDVYSSLVTVTQAAYVPDTATLPFDEFTGGKSAIEGTPGLSQIGLGNDYSTDAKLKFDSTDDCLVLKIDGSPSAYTLQFNIKGNPSSGAWSGTFKLQTSVDGVAYSDFKVYSTLSNSTNGQVEKLDGFADDVRYFKWVYTNQSNGNVGVGKISLTETIAETSMVVSAGFNEGKYWATFFNSAAAYTLPAGAKAYTLNSSKQLYLLGDGSTIPANTAVIIIADSSSITLNKTADTTVAISGGSNLLKGSNYDVVVGGIPSGIPYVLGIKSGVLNFYKFAGEAVPANKAYYIVNE